ncbi:hypothetical protein [Mucilaginibacter puniceus]
MSNIKESTKTSLVIVWGFAVFYLIFKVNYLLYASLILGFCFLFIKPLESLILNLWLKISVVLGWINTRILLTAIFFLIVLPFSWLSKIVKKNDTLLLKRKQLASVFSIRNHKYIPADFENTW